MSKNCQIESKRIRTTSHLKQLLYKSSLVNGRRPDNKNSQRKWKITTNLSIFVGRIVNKFKTYGQGESINYITYLGFLKSCPLRSNNAPPFNPGHINIGKNL